MQVVVNYVRHKRDAEETASVIEKQVSDAQPIKINSLYYAIDDDRPKSYDTGPDAEVGKKLHVLS